MKIFTFATLLLLSGGASISLHAQSQTLQGNWRVDLAETLETMTAPEKMRYNGLAEGTKDRIQRAFGSRIFHLTADGSLEVVWTTQGQIKSVEGTWSYDAGRATLSMIVQEINDTYTVEWKSGDAIVLHYQVTSNAGLFSSLFLRRSL